VNRNGNPLPIQRQARRFIGTRWDLQYLNDPGPIDEGQRSLLARVHRSRNINEGSCVRNTEVRVPGRATWRSTNAFDNRCRPTQQYFPFRIEPNSKQDTAQRIDEMPRGYVLRCAAT